MKRYYFITYQATNRQGSVSVWNQVIDVSPMQFIKHVADFEERGSDTYRDFVVLNTCEITEYEFGIYKGKF